MAPIICTRYNAGREIVKGITTHVIKPPRRGVAARPPGRPDGLGLDGPPARRRPRADALSGSETSGSPVRDLADPPRRHPQPPRWRVTVPSDALELDVVPRLPDQKLTLTVRYWEGAVRAEGRAGAQPLGGRGDAELVGRGAARARTARGDMASAIDHGTDRAREAHEIIGCRGTLSFGRPARFNRSRSC
jgi:Lipocalin-like domain